MTAREVRALWIATAAARTPWRAARGFRTTPKWLGSKGDEALFVELVLGAFIAGAIAAS